MYEIFPGFSHRVERTKKEAQGGSGCQVEIAQGSIHGSETRLVLSHKT